MAIKQVRQSSGSYLPSLFVVGTGIPDLGNGMEIFLEKKSGSRITIPDPQHCSQGRVLESQSLGCVA
jgi:hypothetical protein